MFWVCGFNGFRQFNKVAGKLVDPQTDDKVLWEFIECLRESCKEICVSWCNVLLVKERNAEMFGFINGKPEESIMLKIPVDQKIIQGSCTRHTCALVTEEGDCWQFDLEKKSWKILNNLLGECSSSATKEKKIIKVVYGETMVSVLTQNGVAYSLPNELALPKVKVAELSCGKEHGLLLSESGVVYSWGGGSRGQLGVGTLECSEEPCEVEALTGLTVTKIAAGGWHNAVITREGDMYTWGWNKQGQLGHPVLDSSSGIGFAVLAEPKVVDWPDEIQVSVIEVACGASHTVVMLGNNEIWGCGWNKWGQLANKNFKSTYIMTKIKLPIGPPIRKIVCGAWNTVLISDDECS